jgi:hypothetical protein
VRETEEILMVTRAVLLATLLVLLALPADMLACGDKFLVPGRGARFRDRAVNREAAAVLLYAPPGSGLNRTVQAQTVEASLRAAGYRPALVTSETSFDGALHGRAWDVVVIDLADGPAIVRKLPATRTPHVLPVAYGASKAALNEARHQYRRVLDSPTKQRAIVQAVDDVVAERARTRGKPVGRIGG